MTIGCYGLTGQFPMGKKYFRCNFPLRKKDGERIHEKNLEKLKTLDKIEKKNRSLSWGEVMGSCVHVMIVLVLAHTLNIE